MPRPYRPLALANYFIRQFGYEDGIDHMKLQKLVYLSHGWWLAYHPNDSLSSEQPEVWRYGPVFPSLYQALKGFGDHPIRLPQRERPFEAPPNIDENDQDSAGLLDWVWGRYGGFSGVRLSDITHESGTPWRALAEQHKYRVPNNLKISDNIISEYFKTTEARRLGLRMSGG
jgi:uncharacterized phage-associated protein